MRPRPGRRSLVLGMAALLAGCGGEDGAVSFAPLRYDYLAPIRLNVGSFEIDQRWAPREGDDLASLAPTPPVEALRQMAHDRLQIEGSAGRAVFVIQDASITARGGHYEGSLAVRLEIYTSGGTPAAFAEARVSRRRAEADGGDAAERQALYDITRQMMDDMNVEFEFQVRRSLRDWLAGANPHAAVPAAVDRQDLAPPGR